MRSITDLLYSIKQTSMVLKTHEHSFKFIKSLKYDINNIKTKILISVFYTYLHPGKLWS